MSQTLQTPMPTSANDEPEPTIPNDLIQLAVNSSYPHPQMKLALISSNAGTLANAIRQVVAPPIADLRSNSAGTDPQPELKITSLASLNAFTNHPEQGFDLIHYDVPTHKPILQTEIADIANKLVVGGRLTLLFPPSATLATIEEPIHLQQLRKDLNQTNFVNVLLQSPSASQPYAAPSLGSGFIASATLKISNQASVQQTYSAKALDGSCCDGSSCCCSSNTLLTLEDVASVNWQNGYTPADTLNVPTEAAAFSLGCGNPLGLATIHPGETVLDIGSGGGIDAFIAAKRVGEHGKVIGVDMTPAMLQRARKTATDHGYANISFKHGYAHALPVPNSSVDVIISNCVINLAEDKAAVFSEAFRALRPGGRLEVNDMVFGGAVLPAMRRNPQGWSECVSGALPQEEYLNLLRQAGFSNVRSSAGPSHGVSADGLAIFSVQVSATKD